MILIKNLTVNLGDFVLRDATVEVKQGEYFVLLGPTGAGKTVLLETIAGLYSARSGEVWLDGREITRAVPEERGIGFVYQDHVLFPHLSVRDNITFGLRQQRCCRAEMHAAVDRMVGMLGIDHLLNRKPDTLSGGERQRVALARALVVEPRVLLLDEPLSALDPETKEKVQQELRRLHRELGLTVIHVTHDFEEAVSLADRIAVLGEGRIVQVGTPEEIFRQPNSEFVARFSMARNIAPAWITDGVDGRACAHIGDTRLEVLTDLRGEHQISLRPEDILVSKEPLLSSARNCFKGIITRVLDKGSVLYLTVSVPQEFVCLVTRRAFEEIGLTEGGEACITFKASAVHVLGSGKNTSLRETKGGLVHAKHAKNPIRAAGHIAVAAAIRCLR